LEEVTREDAFVLAIRLHCTAKFNDRVAPVTVCEVDWRGAGWAFVGSDDGTLYLWNTNKPKSRPIGLPGHGDRVNKMWVHWMETRAITASTDETVRVWNIRAGTCLAVLEGHSQAIRDLHVEFEEQLAFTASDDSTIRIWDLHKMRCRRVLTGHTDRVTGLFVHAKRQQLLSASSDCTLRLWDLESESPYEEAVFFGHSAGIVVLSCPAAVPKATLDQGLPRPSAASGLCETHVKEASLPVDQNGLGSSSPRAAAEPFNTHRLHSDSSATSALEPAELGS
jgi:WD40 repeat protein